jgi:hypothetical protein
LVVVGKVNKVLPLRDKRGAYFGKALILGPFLTHKEQLLTIQFFCYHLISPFAGEEENKYIRKFL